jgi:translocator protein
VKGRRWIGLAGWLALCYGAAAIAGQARPGEWYDRLDKPPWTPPDWLFSPVWLVLYGVMGVAAWLVWRRRALQAVALPIGLFLVQLALNVLWPFLFFAARRPDLALAGIVVLWLAIVATVVAFWRVRPIAGALLLPYLAWVGFATALNFEIWRSNP